MQQSTKRRKTMNENDKKKTNDKDLTLIEIAETNGAYGHPYGVQLLGNRFALTIESEPCSLGPLFDKLGDIKMLSFLENYVEDASTLATLAMVNRAFYVFSHIDSFWKNLVLLRFGGRFRFAGASWRETFVHMTTTKIQDHRPVRVLNFFSDLIYRPYLCTTMDLRESWLRMNNVPRRSELSRSDFLREFEIPNKPVVLSGAAKKWRAYKKWTHDYLNRVSGSNTFNCGGFQVTFQNYLQYQSSNKPFEDQPLYLFAKGFCDKIPELEKDYESPSVFGEDLFSLLGTKRPDYRWLIVGPKKSASSFHIDPNGTSAWNAVISGAKRWIMFPPGISPPGVFASNDGADVSQPVSLMEWYLEFYDDEAMERSIQFTAYPGDVVFVPSGWWHAVMNLEDTIAITQNFVGEGNLIKVLDFLKRKQDQVSGVGDDDGRTLHDRFLECLRNKCPKLWSMVQDAATSSSKSSGMKWSETVSKKQEKNGNVSGDSGGFSFGFSFDDEDDDDDGASS